MIACLGETTGANALVYCHQQMTNTSEGQRILTQKPRINTSTVNLSLLRDLPIGTVGRTYYDFLDKNVRCISSFSNFLYVRLKKKYIISVI